MHARRDTARQRGAEPQPRRLISSGKGSLAGTGHHDEAARLGGEALRVGKQYGSERIVSNVRTLRSKLPVRSREVKDLDDMLISLYDGEQ